jgi:hypothetical protein
VCVSVCRQNNSVQIKATPNQEAAAQMGYFYYRLKNILFSLTCVRNHLGSFKRKKKKNSFSAFFCKDSNSSSGLENTF